MEWLEANADKYHINLYCSEWITLTDRSGKVYKIVKEQSLESAEDTIELISHINEFKYQTV